MRTYPNPNPPSPEMTAWLEAVRTDTTPRPEHTLKISTGGNAYAFAWCAARPSCPWKRVTVTDEPFELTRYFHWLHQLNVLAQARR
jgi:hypothetical protein